MRARIAPVYGRGLFLPQTRVEFMFQTYSKRTNKLRQKLAMQRPMTSLVERDFLTHSKDIVFERESWVDAFIDYGHTVSFDMGRTTALRGVIVRGDRLFWLVRRKNKRFGYHSTLDDPLAAVEEAEAAWQHRKRVREQWSLIEDLARDLIAGRKKFRVTIEDAYASPLCSTGIESFMHSVRMSGIRETSGRVAACLMKIDPQVGFVIYEAYMRQIEDVEPSETEFA